MSDPTIIIDQPDVRIPDPSALPIAGLELEVDVEKYLHYTRAFDLPEDQQAQLIEAMWQIMKAFVDIGFEIHPVQQALDARAFDEPACEESGKFSKDGTMPLCDVIKSLIDNSDDLDRQFNVSAAPAGG